jgi:hypothetical protein
MESSSMMKKYEGGVSFCSMPLPTRSCGYQFSNQFNFIICSVGFVNHYCFIWLQMLQFCCICGGDGGGSGGDGDDDDDDVNTPVLRVAPRFN